MSRLAARFLTGTSLALLIAAFVWLSGRFEPGRVALLFVTGICLLSAWELDRMGALRARGLGPALWVATLVLCPGLFFELPGFRLQASAPVKLSLLYAYAALFAPPGYVAALLRGTTPDAFGRPLFESVLASLWLLPPLFALVIIDQVHGTMGLAVLIVLAKVGDNAAYFVGRKLGKRHPFPRISPGKTVAGCVASLVAGVVAGALVLPLTLGERSLAGALLGGVVGGLINLAAQAGDLSESWVKRRAGVKDSSGLLGPSGGVLDVIDSLLLASPVALVLWSWVY